MRFTKDVVEKVLALNDGYESRTYYKSRNGEENNSYKIEDGRVIKRSIGKTSWADSSYDKTYVCDHEETLRFLRNNSAKLNLEI